MLRRNFIQTFGAATVGATLLPAATRTGKKVRVAAVVTAYYRDSHADVIVSRMAGGYFADLKLVEPHCKIVSMFVAQQPDPNGGGARSDLSRASAEKYDFKLYSTIAGALKQGGKSLDVDAVLLIGEHGEYPSNDIGQRLYPRFEFFQAVLAVFREAGAVRPVFFDKHLSYSWEQAKAMYDSARQLRIPIMAGSSIYVSARIPALSLPLDTALEYAVGTGRPAGEGWGGTGLETYAFHALEAFQTMVERRRPGETGLRSVQTLNDDAVWNWAEGDGAWSKPLLSAALDAARASERTVPQLRRSRAAVFILEYRDGFKGAIYMPTRGPTCFAAKLAGQDAPVATFFTNHRIESKYPHFDALTHQIEEFFVSGVSPRPLERNLLVSGALEALLRSRKSEQRILTPELAIQYRAPAKDYFVRLN